MIQRSRKGDCGKDNANLRSMKVKEQRKKDDTHNNLKEDDDLST